MRAFSHLGVDGLRAQFPEGQNFRSGCRARWISVALGAFIFEQNSAFRGLSVRRAREAENCNYDGQNPSTSFHWRDLPERRIQLFFKCRVTIYARPVPCTMFPIFDCVPLNYALRNI